MYMFVAESAAKDIISQAIYKRRVLVCTYEKVTGEVHLHRLAPIDLGLPKPKPSMSAKELNCLWAYSYTHLENGLPAPKAIPHKITQFRAIDLSDEEFDPAEILRLSRQSHKNADEYWRTFNVCKDRNWSLI